MVIDIMVMFEEDKAEGNFTAYVPALRLGVIGDTLEEARSNVYDLIQEALDSGKKLNKYSASIETLSVQLPIHS